MKKVMAMLVAASVAGVAAADIAVDFQNNGGVYTDSGLYNESYTIQLVWNASGIQNQVQAGTLLGAGDVVLQTVNTPVGFAGTFNVGTVFGTDAIVGSDVLLGYLSVRVFDDAQVGVGEFGALYTLDGDGTLTEYDSLTPSTTYVTDPLAGGPMTGGAMPVAAGPNAVEVIPEPATIGLMGVAGLGLYLARRKARR